MIDVLLAGIGVLAVVVAFLFAIRVAWINGYTEGFKDAIEAPEGRQRIPKKR